MSTLKKTLLLVTLLLLLLGITLSLEDDTLPSTRTTSTQVKAASSSNIAVTYEKSSPTTHKDSEYFLPTLSDTKTNNSTLLGIDSNNNGIRDDVEIKIIQTYKEPVKIELMFSYAKLAQDILLEPISQAQVLEKRMSKIADCSIYLLQQGITLENEIDFYEEATYNTKQRIQAYLDFNKALSGGIYSTRLSNFTLEACSEPIQKIMEKKI